MHVINIEWRSEQGDLCEGANADFSLHSFMTFVDFFNPSICESSCGGVPVFCFFFGVSLQSHGYRDACGHIFSVQDVAFSVSHNQGLFIGGHLQNGRLFTGFVQACYPMVPFRGFLLFTAVSSGATPSDIV